MKMTFEYLGVKIVINTIKEEIKIISGEGQFITNAVFNTIRKDLNINLNNYNVLWVKS